VNCYDVIYKLDPVAEVEPGWWRLRWRPIWRHTFSAYRCQWLKLIGVEWWRSDARNGWNRSYKHFGIRIGVGFLVFEGWVKWNFVVHQDGPSDVSIRRPLELPKREERAE